MVTPLNLDYWLSLELTDGDREFLQMQLFEREIPLSTQELARLWVTRRLQLWRDALLKEQRGDADVYKPEKTFQVGQRLAFPALDWQKGEVLEIRPGYNPEIGDFQVIRVKMESGVERQFAANLKEHLLNRASNLQSDEASVDVDAVMNRHGAAIARRLEEFLRNDQELVRIAGRWFPKALLVDINIGHLNLAEAILDVAGGEPLHPAQILKELDLGEDNQHLIEFSLNYAMQEDPRFDEVGPAGQVLWCLKRLEPAEVQETPTFLCYEPIGLDTSAVKPEMRKLEAIVDDELCEESVAHEPEDEVTIALLYPHWRVGALPISYRLRHFFPTAYESPRIRFTLVDARTGQKIPAWVVRERGYVFGLREWYEENGLIPGSLVTIRRSETPGEVFIEVTSPRSTKEWIKTVLVGADGGVVLALLRQVVNAGFDERMSIVISDPDAVDKIWQDEKRGQTGLNRLVEHMMKQLTKLYPHGNIHAQELYAIVNVVRRLPPLDLLAVLANHPRIQYVGDLYFRLATDALEEEF